jgi:predicted nuclease of predicted toxin-antitoxin system
LSNYGAVILAAGKARARRISAVICNERATPPAAKRTSQNAQVISSRVLTALPVRELGLRGAEDDQIFFAVRQAADVVITKDVDFVNLLERHGSPPKIIWLTCGNTSDAALREILTAKFREALALMESGESLVEIGST